MITKLNTFNNSWYKPGSKLKIVLWYCCNVLFLRNPFNPFNFLRKFILKLFGAKIGKGVVIKPSISVKYPWNLSIGNYVWIGEKVWIDNLDRVEIGNNVCISQGALLLCGNHNYKKSSFDLVVKPIRLEDGAWVCAKATVTQGVVCGAESVLSVQSVAINNLEPYSIYQGNPAVKVRERVIS